MAGLIDKMKKAKKGCYVKQKVVAIQIPKYKYVDIPLAKEIHALKLGKVKKVGVGKIKKKDHDGDDDWEGYGGRKRRRRKRNIRLVS